MLTLPGAGQYSPFATASAGDVSYT